MQIPTPPTTGTLTKWDWGRAQASAFLTPSPGGSDAGNPRIAHLESLVTERDGPGADTPAGKLALPVLVSSLGFTGQVQNPHRIRGTSIH